MMKLQDLLQKRKAVMDATDSIFSTVEKENRAMTAHETRQLASNHRELADLNVQIKSKEQTNTLSAHVRKHGIESLLSTPDGSGRTSPTPAVKQLSEGYFADFHTYLASRGTKIGEHLSEGADGFGGFKLPGISAAAYEGGSTTGAPVVPSFVEQNIVELAPAETGVIKLAQVIPTVADLKIPRKTAFGSVGLKAEGDGTGSNLFTDSDVDLDQFTLSAFMVGGSHTVSWELLQDVNSFQSFAVNDLLLELGVFLDNKFVNGTGSGQPQGLLGNVGAGVTAVAAGSDNYASELLQATFDVLGKLNAIYHPGAAWLMSRQTGATLRKAQMGANLFTPIWTRVGDQDFLHGYPVEYSAAMPAIAPGNTPILFGNFKAGYVVGQRGGGGVSVKLLDQPKATEGLLIILAYQRVDGRVRRSEAIQGITLHT